MPEIEALFSPFIFRKRGYKTVFVFRDNQPGRETMSELDIPAEIEIFAVKHLPIVRTYVEKLGLVELLNDLVESEMEVEPGVLFLGMLLDTLSGRSPLYR